jgi:hypothetical protein
MKYCIIRCDIKCLEGAQKTNPQKIEEKEIEDKQDVIK